MALFKQTVRGNSRSVDVTVSAADEAVILSLMEGKVAVYDEKSSGGTDIATTLATLRAVKLGVNRKLDKLSATVNIKHMAPNKHLSDVFSDKALFDADFVTTLSATGIRAIYEGQK